MGRPVVAVDVPGQSRRVKSALPAKPTAIRCGLLIALAVVTAGRTYIAGRQLGMSTTLSTRVTFYALPYAVSHRYFGTRGYVILRDVADLFVHTHPNVTNETLTQSIALSPSSERLMFIPGDDKGDADFAVLALRLFGMRVESLYYLWFALYFVGSFLFLIGWWNQEAPLVALCLLTLSVYVAFYALPLTAELGSIHNPRAFGVVSLVAVLDLSFALMYRQPLTAARLCRVILQAALIVFSVHVRGTELWQVVAIAGVGAWCFVRDRSSLASLWPCTVLVVVLAGLGVCQRLAADRVYRETQLDHRVVWHNIGIGFAVNPNLAEKYSLYLDDLPMIKLIHRYLLARNRESEIDLLFRTPGHEEYLFLGITKDFYRYERVAREVVLSIVWNNKRSALRTFAFDKPRVLLMQLAWAMGYRGFSVDEMHLEGQIGHIASDEAREHGSIYLAPFRRWAVGGLIATLLLGGVGVQRRGEYAGLATLSVWLYVISLAPMIVAYPIISAMAVVFATLSFVALASCACLSSIAISRFTRPASSSGRGA